MSDSRDQIAAILERIAAEGLSGPRDLDVAIDAILEIIAEDGSCAATSAADMRERAALEGDRWARFAAEGGPHSCTDINGALWYGRQQYSETIAAAIRALPLTKGGSDVE